MVKVRVIISGLREGQPCEHNRGRWGRGEEGGRGVLFSVGQKIASLWLCYVYKKSLEMFGVINDFFPF